jgi:hypothetical protein
MEKRNRERMVLTAFCRVAPVGNRRRSAWKRIENISGAGLLVEWSRDDQEQASPSIGDIYSVELQLPPHPVFGQRVLQYKAKVVRVTKQKTGRVLAGLQTTQTRFRPLAPGTRQQAAEASMVN